MDENLKQLLSEIREKLESDCENGWDRHTSMYIVPQGKYTREQEMERGDSWAWGLIQQIDKLLEEEK